MMPKSIKDIRARTAMAKTLFMKKKKNPNGKIGLQAKEANCKEYSLKYGIVFKLIN